MFTLKIRTKIYDESTARSAPLVQILALNYRGLYAAINANFAADLSWISLWILSVNVPQFYKDWK